MIRTYTLLAKPGIIMGNLITTTCGFALASRGQFHFSLFFYVLFGLGLIIGSACIFNNYMDRHIDQKMERTRKRGFAQGLVAPGPALLIAFAMVLLGQGVLYTLTTALATFLAFLGFFIYVCLYTVWKPYRSWATLVGSVSGALPPVIGYVAVNPTLTPAAILLFLILVLWQMPHFFAIAMARFPDYAAASIPILPIRRGFTVTKIHMLLYVTGFALTICLLPCFVPLSPLYSLVALFSSFSWLFLALQGFRVSDDVLWARRMFRLSLLIITLLSFAITFS